MKKILLIKTSSMGDLIHNLPIVTDIKRWSPDCRIDWVSEETFGDVPALHPGVDNVIPVALRRWRRSIHNIKTIKEIVNFLYILRDTKYDYILDSQGLIKSALITRLANGIRYGFNRQRAREPLAALFYDKKYFVPFNLHAVDRNRLLASKVFNYNICDGADYGITAPELNIDWMPTKVHAVLIHSASRRSKLFPKSLWIELGKHLLENGVTSIIPWGNEEEYLRSKHLARSIRNAIVPPALRINELAFVISTAKIVVGVDTGLTHLAAALRVPVIALYCASNPGMTGVYAATLAKNLGSEERPPRLPEIINEIEYVLGATKALGIENSQK